MSGMGSYRRPHRPSTSPPRWPAASSHPWTSCHTHWGSTCHASSRLAARSAHQRRQTRSSHSFIHTQPMHYFRFRPGDPRTIVNKLGLPVALKLKGAKSGWVSGESATLDLMYRLHYPSPLNDDQEMWGRDYTTLDRIFNTALDRVFRLHEHKVCGNVCVV